MDSRSEWKAWRIADRRHPIYSGAGAALHGGRWNSAGRPVIYAAATYACALLERLVHLGTQRIPRHQALVEITIPDWVEVERAPVEGLPGWDTEAPLVSQRYGDRWLAEERTAVLVVPSVVAAPDENVVINPNHADFVGITHSEPRPVEWDLRLFGDA